MTNPTPSPEEEKLIEEFRIRFTEEVQNCRSNLSMESLKFFLKESFSRIRTETVKAFGGCTLCYGKGYATQKEHWTGRGEHDIGQGDVVVDTAAPFYLPCSCDRGKQIEKMDSRIRADERRKVQELLPVELVLDPSLEGRELAGVKMKDYLARGYNLYRKQMLEILSPNDTTNV